MSMLRLGTGMAVAIFLLFLLLRFPLSSIFSVFCFVRRRRRRGTNGAVQWMDGERTNFTAIFLYFS